MRTLFALLLAAVAAAAAETSSAAHIVEIDRQVSSPGEGLLLGNGDLSVSVYQTAADVVFRLGKNDVWDRRIDYSKQFKPPTVKEFIDGVLKCGWKVSGWNATNIEEMKKLPGGERLLEITRGKTALRSGPYPMPKPTGEMRLRLPRDLGVADSAVHRLHIEEGRIEVELKWKRGVVVRIEAVVDPDLNVLAVDWKVEGWNDETRISNKTPLYVSVHRWADPDYESWVRRSVEDNPAYPGKPVGFDGGIKPLPPPEVVGENKIEQRFYPDALFPQGFRCRLTLDPIVKCGSFWRPKMPPGGKNAYFLLQGGTNVLSGSVALAVTTSRDRTLDAPKPLKSFAQYRQRAVKAGAEYWAKSGFSMPGDKFLEDLWYATYHARRCILKSGAVPPGLFFPSVLSDYSRWNGDYHVNYNFHSIFWGDFTANRLDQAEAYMDGVEFSVPVGRKIARDYYGCRGVFFQLEQFPCLAEDDYSGRLPLGRMAYMTGWMMTHYWEYYMYTKDLQWLAKRGYPMIKGCALFYLDFLKKAPHPDLPPELKDGKYHAFPSVQGEGGWKKPMELCDRPQVMMHVRFSLWAAIEAAKALDVDKRLRSEWQDRLDNLAASHTRKSFTGKDADYAYYCYLCCPPENGSHPAYRPSKPWDGEKAKKTHHSWDYLGILHWGRIGHVRGNECVPERTFRAFREDLVRWRHPNGLVGAMPEAVWNGGAWTESLSCMAPFQEMILQSWDGAIRLFPRWPESQDVKIRSWRAQGAFLVDAEFSGGKVRDVTITSEKGENCLLWGAWKIVDENGKPVTAAKDKFGRLEFKTVPGGKYRLKGEEK